MNRGFTLIEMILSLSLFSIVILGVLFVVSSVGKRIRFTVDEARLMAEMSYALDNIKLYCAGASKIDEGSSFRESGGARPDFYFRRERNVHTITPSAVADDIWYRYYKNADNNIVLRNTETLKDEVIVGAMFNPQISFEYEAGFEPNFFKVTITGEISRLGIKKRISKTAGVRLWYAEVVQ